MIRIVIADDHTILRDGLKQLLAAEPDVQVVGEACDGFEALDLVRKRDFDVLLLDLSMPGRSGMELIKLVRSEKPKLRILVLSMHAERQYAVRAVKAGASGYLTKDSASEQLVGAIRKVAAGGVYITDAAAASLVAGAGSADAPAHTLLSDREYVVFRMLAEGRGPGEIASQPFERIWVRGHTDNDPVKKPATIEKFPHGNLQLSAARAVEVAALLADNGIPQDRLVVAGFGPTEPVAPNDQSENKRKNRRVEIFVLQEPVSHGNK